MPIGLLIGGVLLGALTCPLMMLLGRRGIGPGCAMSGCAAELEDTVESLRERQRDLAAQIAKLESDDHPTLSR